MPFKTLEATTLLLALVLVPLLAGCKGTRDNPRLNFAETTFRDNALELLETAPADTMMSFHIRYGVLDFPNLPWPETEECPEYPIFTEAHGLYTRRGDFILEWHGFFNYKQMNCLLHIEDHMEPGDEEGSPKAPAIKASMRIKDEFMQENILRVVVQRGGLNSPGAPVWLKERVADNLKDNKLLLAARWGEPGTMQELLTTMEHSGEGAAWLRFQDMGALGRARVSLEALEKEFEQESGASNTFAIQTTGDVLRIGGKERLGRFLAQALFQGRLHKEIRGMSPTLAPYDSTYSTRPALMGRPLRRGDIIQFMLPQSFASERVMEREDSGRACGSRFLFENKDRMRIGRIIGLPGDRITLEDGFVTLGGKKANYTRHRKGVSTQHVYNERLPGSAKAHTIRIPHASAAAREQAPSSHVIVPEDELFVLFDDRAFMTDSRCWGTLPTAHIDSVVHTFGFGLDEDTGSYDWSQALGPL